jgi:hypothetical protein
VAVVTANNGASLTIMEANWLGGNQVDTRNLSYSQLALRPGGDNATFALQGYILPPQQ